jgi:hypothetical protein
VERTSPRLAVERASACERARDIDLAPGTDDRLTRVDPLETCMRECLARQRSALDRCGGLQSRHRFGPLH